MTNTALVAGPSGRACDVAAALQAQGFATITVDSGEPVSKACGRVSPRSVDCYVQLPAEPGRGEARGRGLLGLVDAVAAVAPLLANDATVVLMADDRLPHHRDRLLDDAVGVLAEAVVADHGSDGVRVSVVGAHESPAGIAAAARGRGRPRSGPSLADFEPELSYADWRSQVLSLSSVNDATYFGWKGADGRTPVVIIRGAVVSPLRPLGPGHLSWGNSGGGATLLARALLADLLGTAGCCPVCGGAGEGGCLACGGTCLSAHAERCVGDFVQEFVVPLRAEGFELPAADLQAWIDQRVGILDRIPEGVADRGGSRRRRRIRRRQRPGLFDGVGSPVPVRPSVVH